MTRGVCSRHCFDRIDSVRVVRQAGSSLLLFFLVKFQLALPVLPSSWLGLGEAMESKIMVTILCQFSSSWSSNKCHVYLLAKSIVWVLPPGGLSKVPNSPKFPASLAMAFLEKRKKTRCGIACVPGDWEDATRFVLVVSVLISMVQLAQKDPTYIPYTLYTCIHIQWWKRAVLLGSLLQTTRKVKRKWRTSRACCFVWENVPFWNRLFTTSCFDCLTMFESLLRLKQELHKSALEHSWSECSSSTSRLIWSPKRHFVDLPVAEKTAKFMCYPILVQRKLNANDVDRQLASRKAQSSSCFDLDSDRVTVLDLVPRQMEVSISVWGKPLELGNSLLSTNQRPFIYTGPRPFSGDPVR